MLQPITQAPQLTPEEAIASMDSIYEECSRHPNGKPRKNPFFKCLATLKARLGIHPDGMIPENVYAALAKLTPRQEDASQQLSKKAPIADKRRPEPAKSKKPPNQAFKLKHKQVHASRRKVLLRDRHLESLLEISRAAKRHRLYASTAAPSRASTKPNQWVQELGKPKPILNRALR